MNLHLKLFFAGILALFVGSMLMSCGQTGPLVPREMSDCSS